MPTRHVLPLRDVDLSSLPQVGGKNASLGELIRHLVPLGVRVPNGFAVVADAFRLHLRAARLDEEIYAALDRLDVRDVAELARIGRSIRERIRGAPLPAEVEAQILAAYETLSSTCGEQETDVAVRSSATAEDLPTASFAGQQETFLNVRGRAHVIRAVRDCMASLFTDRAIVYRSERGFGHRGVGLSVGVQKMVRSDLASAGVIFTLDPDSGSRDVVVITGAFGLGETVVQGRVDPDEVWVHKATLAKGFRPIIRRQVGAKARKLIYAEGGTSSVVEVAVPARQQAMLVLDDDEVLTLARWAMAIEAHYSSQTGRPIGMDLEWAKDGRTGELFIVQARPETVHSAAGPGIEVFRLSGEAKIVVRGKSVGARIGVGRVRIVRSKADLPAFQDGEVLVAPMTDPDWQPVMRRAAAIVTDHGGRTCHAAIVSRELGIPCVVGTTDGTSVLTDGAEVTVSCAEGDEGHVYEGRVPFVRDEIDPSTLPVPRVPVMLNVSDPQRAFHVGRLPSAGVGLARIEFIVSSWIGVHPMALLHPERVTEPAVRAAIRERMGNATEGAEFFVDALATGVAQIAAAFHPRPVIVRFSDFKTNEYAGLLGGTSFEPVEANPMIGFRGASRYYDERYREAFALECAAIRRVREVMGFENVKVMIPFCRTLAEGRSVLGELDGAGLRRGENGLEVWVMCEVPNNVILAREFSELFDGFSIGSNDLTQLTLGIDRDSSLLAHLFDERDPGVKAMIQMVITAAHEKGRRVGLCGQAPSDHPEFAAFLADAGIDSISVTADAFARVVTLLHEATSTVAASPSRP